MQNLFSFIKAEKARSRSIFQNLGHFIVGLLVWVGLLILLRTYVVSVAKVEGSSMLPTLADGDLVLVGKWSKVIEPGEIGVFREKQSESNIVKRVVASGPATVFIENRKLFVNDLEQPEPTVYAVLWDEALFYCTYSPEFFIKAGEYFVLGDNRCHSGDSRFVGAFDKDSLIGIVLFRIWPLRFVHW